LRTGTTYRGTGMMRDVTIFLQSGGITETFVNEFRIEAIGGRRQRDRDSAVPRHERPDAKRPHRVCFARR
jgi:hypothetical protein